MADPSWQWDIEDTVSFIRSGNHGVVALQFPDSLLGSAPSVAQLLQQRLGNVCKVSSASRCIDNNAKPAVSRHSVTKVPELLVAQVYVLADTAYNPLAVDEVAAQHIHASCVVRCMQQQGCLQVTGYRPSHHTFALLPLTDPLRLGVPDPSEPAASLLCVPKISRGEYGRHGQAACVSPSFIGCHQGAQGYCHSRRPGVPARASTAGSCGPTGSTGSTICMLHGGGATVADACLVIASVKQPSR